MNRVELKPHVLDQQQVLFYGCLCGYCGTREGMPVTFLAETRGQIQGQNKLNNEEKADVIAYVQEKVGAVKRTKQNRAAFAILDARGVTSEPDA